MFGIVTPPPPPRRKHSDKIDFHFVPLPWEGKQLLFDWNLSASPHRSFFTCQSKRHASVSPRLFLLLPLPLPSFLYGSQLTHPSRYRSLREEKMKLGRHTRVAFSLALSSRVHLCFSPPSHPAVEASPPSAFCLPSSPRDIKIPVDERSLVSAPKVDRRIYGRHRTRLKRLPGFCYLIPRDFLWNFFFLFAVGL